MGYIENFCSVLISHSLFNQYDSAIREWVYRGDAENRPDHCICGHTINQRCIVENQYNRETLIIGNCCIHKFGIEREHWNRSRSNYLMFALSKCSSEQEESFVRELQEKLGRYSNLYMTDRQKEWLERITGKVYRFKYQYPWRRTDASNTP